MKLKKRLTITYAILMSFPILIALIGFILVVASGVEFVPKPIFMEVLDVHLLPGYHML